MENVRSARDAFRKKLTKMEEEANAPVKIDIPFELIGTAEEKQHLAKIVNRISKSKLGKETLETAAKAGYVLYFVQSSGSRGACNNTQKMLSLNPTFSDDVLTGTLTHEARHAGQFLRGTVLDWGKASLKKQIMSTRAKEADAQSTACVTLYELKQKGDESAYNKFAETNPSIVEPFEKAVNEGENANMAAFKGWYDDKVIKIAYEDWQIRALQNFKEAKDFNEFSFDDNLSGKEIAEKICVDENSKSYFTDDPKILEGGKFASVEPETMDFFKKFMKERKENHGLEPDKSMYKIPVKNNVVKNKLLANAMQGR